MFPDLSHDRPAFFAQTLERVRRSPRLAHAAAKETRAALLDRFGHGEGLLATLDRARPGDDTELTSSNAGAADANDRFFGTQIQRNQLVRLSYTDGLGDTRQTFAKAAAR